MLFRQGIYKLLRILGNGNKDTYIASFGLCARLKDLDLGRQVHNKLLKSNAVEFDESVCSAMINMYGKCGDIKSARKVVDKFKPPRTVVIWTSMLAAYSEHGGFFEESLKLFSEMQHEGVVPNKSTFSALLAVSAESFSMKCGNSLHALAAKTGVKGHKNVQDTMIDMYSRTGDIESAENVFLDMSSYDRDIVTWNTMIHGYNLHGHGKDALDAFNEMLELGEDDPDYETFVGVLSACGLQRRVEQGFYYFYELMKQKGVEPGLEHYRCIVIMLIKIKRLKEALKFILSAPISWKTDVFGWTSLLEACHDSQLTADVATKMIKYCGVTKVREVMERKKDTKEEMGARRSCWMELNGKTLYFPTVTDRDPGFDELKEQMGELYSYPLAPGDFTDREEAERINSSRTCYHAAEIAIFYGLEHATPLAPIYIITSSGEICYDCHYLAFALAANYDKLFIVRDDQQFHNFLDGYCSCKISYLKPKPN